MPTGPLRRLRRFQSRAFSRLCLAASSLPGVRRIIGNLGTYFFAERLLVGHRRRFDSKLQAEQAIAHYDTEGHQHPGYIQQHLDLAARARPSDYAALFHLGKLLPNLTGIVDVGGNTGNLFFCYSQYLDFPAAFSWTVVDLEASITVGRALARERGVQNLNFTTEISACVPVDLVLISGALQFLEVDPVELLASWSTLPTYILINRSPVSDRPAVYGIQDQGEWMTAAKVLNRHELLSSLSNAGYTLVDEWSAYELHLRFPLRPQDSVDSYSGFLFSRVPQRDKILDERRNRANIDVGDGAVLST